VTRALAIAALACACHARPLTTDRASADDAIVVIKSNVGDAQLYVDGHLVGPLSVMRGGVAVDPGKHRVELRHDDYFSRYIELDLRRAERRKLDVEMMPVLP
jgi:hypothetical protein